jgi:hypothetical protein
MGIESENGTPVADERLPCGLLAFRTGLLRIVVSKEKPMSDNNSVAFRGIWLAIIVLGALFIAAVTGAVFYAAGAPLPTTIGAAGGAFLGAVTLGVRVWKFLAE